MNQQSWQNTARPAPLAVDEDGGLAALMGTQNVTLARETVLKEPAILQAARDVLQTAFADEGRKQDGNEDRNFPIACPTRLASNDRPGKNEDGFNIKNHKEHRDQVKLSG